MEFTPSGCALLITCALCGEYALSLAAERLNLRSVTPELPAPFRGYFDSERYARAQNYLRASAGFDAVSATFGLAVSLGMMWSGAFGWLDSAARSFGLGPVLTGLVFTFLLRLLMELADLPFDAYETFVLEQRFSFNRTTPGTFFIDILKGWGLSAAVGGPVLAFVFWLFGRFGPGAWLAVWAFLSLFQLFMAFVSPAVIMPLFNRFRELEPGPLRDSIGALAARAGLAMKGVYVMDGSRRSSKGNAFFAGFGRFRRIVLYDTMIDKHSVEELTAIVAHEMGHYRKGHVFWFMGLSMAASALTLWLLSGFLDSRALFGAFGVEEPSVYAGLVFFGFLYSPISLAMGLGVNWLSRRQELEADDWAAAAAGPLPLASALKKLSADNLSNLTPHPLKVFLEYSHPPVLERVERLERAAAG